MSKRMISFTSICVFVFVFACALTCTVSAQGEGVRIAGEVTTVSPGTGFTLDTGGQSFSILVDRNTRFFSADDSLTGIHDMQPGMRVYVVAFYQAEGLLLATHVGLDDNAAGQDAPETLRTSGLITGLNTAAGTFSVESSTGETYQFLVSGDTIFHSPDDSAVALADLHAGMSAVVCAVKQSGEWIARHVAAADLSGADPQQLLSVETRQAGVIVSSSGRQLTMQTALEQQVVYQCDESTIVRSIDGTVTALSQLEAGMGVVVGAEGDHAVWIAVGGRQGLQEPVVPEGQQMPALLQQQPQPDSVVPAVEQPLTGPEAGDMISPDTPEQPGELTGLQPELAPELEEDGGVPAAGWLQPQQRSLWSGVLQSQARGLAGQVREIFDRSGR